MVSCGYKDHDLVGSQELLQSGLGLQFLALFRQQIIEVALLEQLAHHIKSSLEDSLDVHLWESGPLSVELKPLANPLVTQNIEGLDVAVATWLQSVDQTTCELTLGSLECTLDKHHARVVLDQVIDLTEGELLFLLE